MAFTSLYETVEPDPRPVLDLCGENVSDLQLVANVSDRPHLCGAKAYVSNAGRKVPRNLPYQIACNGMD